MVNCKNLFDKNDHFFLRPYLHQARFVSNVLEKAVDLTILSILGTARAMLINFCLVNTYLGDSYLGVQSILFASAIFFPVKRLKIILLKDKKDFSS